MNLHLQRRRTERRGLRLWPVGPVLAITFALALIVAAGVFYVGWRLLDARGLEPEPHLTSDTLFDLVKLSFGVVAGAGALVALVVAYRRQRVDEDGALREATRLHTERFTTAGGQLGDANAAVRLAGIHALAGLADDAPTRELRQTCIDVLCAYLCLPYTAQADLPAGDAPARHDYLANRQVRHTVIRLIRDHLRLPADHARSWQGHDFDFTTVVFDGGDFSGSTFSGGLVKFDSAAFSSGTVRFDSAIFSGGTVGFPLATFSGGTVIFTNAVFSGGRVGFTNAVISDGTVRFDSATFSHGTVGFTNATFSGGTVEFTSALFSGSAVDFSQARFSGSGVDFSRARFSGDRVSFRNTMFTGGRVGFSDARFSGGTADFTNARTFSGGMLYFTRAAFSGSTVDFTHTAFSGGTVGFTITRFSGGTVNFTSATFGGTVSFDGATFSGGTVGFIGATGPRPPGLPTQPGPVVRLAPHW